MKVDVVAEDYVGTFMCVLLKQVREDAYVSGKKNANLKRGKNKTEKLTV